MKRNIEITMPESWADVSLKKYLTLQSELESYSDDEEAQTAIMLHHLCEFPPEYINNIPKASYEELKKGLITFLNPADMPLQTLIWIDGIEYGFEPNLSQIAYGAYADISKWDTVTIDDNWARIMSILYRPVLTKANKGDLYSIIPYEGKIEPEKFEKLGMDIHFGALFFFVHSLMDLLNYTLNSLTPMELRHNFNTILPKSGNLTQLLLNSRMEILEG
jgi:hypothetical protein